MFTFFVFGTQQMLCFRTRSHVCYLGYKHAALIWIAKTLSTNISEFVLNLKPYGLLWLCCLVNRNHHRNTERQFLGAQLSLRTLQLVSSLLLCRHIVYLFQETQCVRACVRFRNRPSVCVICMTPMCAKDPRWLITNYHTFQYPGHSCFMIAQKFG